LAFSVASSRSSSVFSNLEKSNIMNNLSLLCAYQTTSILPGRCGVTDSRFLLTYRRRTDVDRLELQTLHFTQDHCMKGERSDSCKQFEHPVTRSRRDRPIFRSHSPRCFNRPFFDYFIYWMSLPFPKRKSD